MLIKHWRTLSAQPEPPQEQLEQIITWKDRFLEWVSDTNMWENILIAGLKIIFIFLITRIFVRVVYRLIDRSLERREKSRLQMNPRRFVTVGELLKNVTWFASNFIMIMLILGEVGVHLAPLLAGAGVLGLAIGFGAQSLVKDVITGFFIILEDQFAVGDVIQTGTLKGTVEMIGLRSTRLVSWTGEVHIVPNGMITNVTNYSIGNALAVVDLPFSHSRKLENNLDMLKRAMLQLKEGHSEALNHVPNVLGVQSMTASEYVIRIAAECTPGDRAKVERLIQAYAKEAVEQEEEAERKQLAEGTE